MDGGLRESKEGFVNGGRKVELGGKDEKIKKGGNGRWYCWKCGREGRGGDYERKWGAWRRVGSGGEEGRR